MNDKGKRVLITIDEADNSEQIKLFVQAYQSLIRQGYKILLLMTGLYENISKLQDDRSLTLLYRAPKINLEPLNINSIATSYEANLGVDSKKALEFAKFTNGYAYAYQVLGHLFYNEDAKELTPTVINDFDQYMAITYTIKSILSSVQTNKSYY